MRSSRLMLLAALLITFSLAAATLQTAYSTGFSTDDEINLSNSPGPKSGKDIAAAGNNAYVTWFDRGTGEIVFRKITHKEVGESVVLESGANPQLAAEGKKVYLFYDGADGRLHLKRSVDSGKSFDAGTALGVPAGADIVVQRNEMYAAYPLGEGRMQIAKSVDGGATFGPVVNLSGGIAGYFTEPQISAFRNHVYVVWHVERGLPYFTLNTYVAVSDDRGESFTMIQEGEGNQSFDSDVSASRSGAYVVVANYTSGNTEILIRDRNEGAFETAAIAGSANWTNDPQIAVQGRHVYVLWEEGDDGAGYANDVFFRAYKLKDLG